MGLDKTTYPPSVLTEWTTPELEQAAIKFSQSEDWENVDHAIGDLAVVAMQHHGTDHMIVVTIHQFQCNAQIQRHIGLWPDAEGEDYEKIHKAIDDLRPDE